MDKEVWKPIKDYEGLYSVSNMGRVRSEGRWIMTHNGEKEYRYYKKDKILKGYVDREGYRGLLLSKDGKLHHCKVHRLVAQTFIPNPEHHNEVDHKNKLRSDNRVSNLRWVNRKENMKGVLNNRNPAIAVVCESNGKVYKSISVAAKDLGISSPALARKLKFYGGKATIKGLVLRYKI